MNFETAVRQAMHDRGLSVRALARGLYVDHAYLSRVLNGRQKSSDALVAGLDAFLGLEGRLMTLRPQVATLAELRPDADMHARLAAVLAEPSRVDSAVVSWFDQTLADHRRAEDEIGGKPLLTIIKSQLTIVDSLGKQAPDPIRQDLTHLASQYAQFMAWIVNDSGDKAGAVEWYSRAHDWALEAGDANMAATALSMKAHIAWGSRDGFRTVRMGEAALWYDGRISAGIQGMASQMVARGYALNGDDDGAHKYLDVAQEFITEASDHPEDEPGWMYFYGDDWFTAQRGMIELDLGNGPQAIELLQTTMDSLPTNYKRDRAWYGALLAKAHVIAGDLDSAAQLGANFAPAAKALNQYAVKELKEVAARVTLRLPKVGSELGNSLK